MRVFQCAVMGSGGVGKSAITVRFINGAYLECYDPTIEDSYRKQFSVDGSPCLLEILDTAGIDQFLSLNDLFIRESEAFILVFSLTQRETFEEVMRLHSTILRVKASQGVEAIPIILVGNKCDLLDDREVYRTTAEKLAEQWRAPYFETSARTDTNVTAVFDETVRMLRRMDRRRPGRIRDTSWVRGKKCVIL